MQTTGNLNLKKPEGTDIVDINDLNDNMDILDAEVSRVASTTANGRMSATDKTKLNGIATGANNYVHPSTHPASIIAQDSSNRFVTDAEKSAWNAKAGTSVATTSANGLMSSTDKSKLDGVAAGANNYVHPSSHPASIITQDANNRFVTDTEKAAWNAKAGTSVATTSANGLMSTADKELLANREGYGTTTGTGTVYSVTLSPAPTALVDGLAFAVKIHLQNTGSATINVNGLGAKTIRKSNGSTLSAGNFRQNSIYTLRYNGTDFILQGEGGEYGDATAGNVLAGKTIGTDAGLVTGTMPNRTGHVTAQSISRSGTTLRLRPQPGYYAADSSNSVQISDSNFIPGNIREGVNLFGLSGSFVSGKQVSYISNYTNIENNTIITFPNISFIPSQVILFVSMELFGYAYSQGAGARISSFIAYGPVLNQTGSSMQIDNNSNFYYEYSGFGNLSINSVSWGTTTTLQMAKSVNSSPQQSGTKVSIQSFRTSSSGALFIQ